MLLPVSIGIIGTGCALPDEIITNDHLEASAGLSDEWIFARTGIRERRRAGKNESASGLGAKVALNALESANLDGGEIDSIVCTTISPDVPMPAMAYLSVGINFLFATEINNA